MHLGHPPPSAALLAAVERARRRLWAHCYRMTGSRTDAEDLAQEAIARAIEREPALADRTHLEGWLFRIATMVTLDHLRRRARERRVTDLVDPLDMPDLPAGGQPAPDPEAAAVLRDDVRFAVVVALQTLSPRQRAALLLHDVCDRPLHEVAAARGTHGADRVADPAVVERVAHAIAARSTDALVALLADDVWGVVDGGGVVRAATRPSHGRRSVARRFANAARRLLVEPACEVRRLNGEAAVVVAVAGAPFATVHLETRAGAVAAIRVVRDPAKLAGLRGAAA